MTAVKEKRLLLQKCAAVKRCHARSRYESVNGSRGEGGNERVESDRRSRESPGLGKEM